MARFEAATKTEIKKARSYVREQNALWPNELAPVPRSQWPTVGDIPARCMRSNRFLALVYNDRGTVRLTFTRTTLGFSGRMEEGISWDELQALKRECGYGDRDAVEVYPADRDIINVANMRHLWIMPEPLTFAWRAHDGHGEARDDEEGR